MIEMLKVFMASLLSMGVACFTAIFLTFCMAFIVVCTMVAVVVGPFVLTYGWWKSRRQ